MIRFSESKNFSPIRFLLVIHFSFFISFVSFSQFAHTWVSVYGGISYDRGQGIAQTFDGGYIVCGSTASYGMGSTDIYLLKVDTAGKFQWHNTFGGLNVENCFSVKQTQDTGYIICGYTNSYGAGGYDAFLIKTDSLGNLQWQKTYGGNNWDFTYWAEETSDGGFILAGETFSHGNNGRSFLVKTNNLGDTTWTRTYGDTIANYTREVHQTPDHGYIFGGSRQTGPGNKDFFLTKTNPAGDTLWTRNYPRINNDSCNSIAMCKDKGFLLGGSTDINGKLKDYFLKTDSAGNFLYAVVDTPSGTNTLIISRIRERMDGDIVTLVNADDGSNRNINLYDWNTAGWWPWGRGFGGSADEKGYDFVETSDSGFALAGYTASFGKGPDNIFICKTNSIGGYNSTVNSFVSTNEISEKNENTLIYPNPFSDNLFLKVDRSFFMKEKAFTLDITDLCGRKITSTERNVSLNVSEPIRIEIPAEKFTGGIYIVSLTSGNKKIYRKLMFAK